LGGVVGLLCFPRFPFAVVEFDAGSGSGGFGGFGGFGVFFAMRSSELVPNFGDSNQSVE